MKYPPPAYRIPAAPTALREGAVSGLWLCAGLGLLSLALPWANVVQRVIPTGLTTTPTIIQAITWGWAVPHGWMLGLLMLWVASFAGFVRRTGVSWLDAWRGRLIRSLLGACLLAHSGLLITSFVLGLQPCRLCPQMQLGWGLFMALAALAGALLCLLLLRYPAASRFRSR